ncbi:MAG: endonuclease III [Verrucomicrobia bacterium]|jgi:endonuclease-3|nr:endonuclease III [Verrucomicrobiota bacterium]MDA7504963.1 endonuclease III [Akkermansiaceae bacterium]MDA7516217.1 endonuclease III [bacterium]MBT6165933.1 endonuclease III [Verrucomicrobiota bacterium]MBT6399693.1 endonuclease III [Verrucomicrobiota bacterium]
MLKQERADYILRRLEELYPETPVPLDHTNSFTLLVAVLLSAQCTDVRVNLVTPALFKKASNAVMMVKLTVEEIDAIVRPCGLAPRKAKAIRGLSEILLSKHGGEVPANFPSLEELPGVGHKTASVVMSQAFGVPAFAVDTHIHRLAQRWKLTDGRSVKRTEEDLKKLFPREAWNKLHLQIIFYGREYCSARGCDGTVCEICKALFPLRKTPIKTKKP